MKILVPDSIPNNMTDIREIRGLSIKEASDMLLIDKNFLSSVENWRKNFSGKTTIRIMEKFNVNFYQMYDINKTIKNLPVTDYFEEAKKEVIKISINQLRGTYINVQDFNNNEIINCKNGDLSKASCELKEVIKEEVLKTLNVTNELIDFSIDNVKKSEDYIYFSVHIRYNELQIKYMDFDIRFAEKENIELADMAMFKGFREEITFIEKSADEVIIKDDKIILDRDYKIPLDDNPKKFILTNEIDINNENLGIETDSLTSIPLKVKLRVVKSELNNIKFLKEQLNLSDEQVYTALGILPGSYNNLGSQKISTKVMWRLVELFKIPFELIFNIDEYYKEFCLDERRIARKDIVV